MLQSSSGRSISQNVGKLALENSIFRLCRSQLRSYHFELACIIKLKCSPPAFPLGIVVTTSQDTLKSLRSQINHYTHEGQTGLQQPLLAPNWRYLDGM